MNVNDKHDDMPFVTLLFLPPATTIYLNWFESTKWEIGFIRS